MLQRSAAKVLKAREAGEDQGPGAGEDRARKRRGISAVGMRWIGVRVGIRTRTRGGIRIQGQAKDRIMA